MPVPLLDVCEPYFRFVCALNRRARELAKLGQPDRLDYAKIRGETLRRLDDCRREADSQRLADDFRRVEPDLVALVDDVVRDGPFPFARQWADTPISQERFDDVAWRTTFWTRLQALLQENTADPSVLGRLWVAYTCVGLGFTGELARNPGKISEFLELLVARLDPVGAPARSIDHNFDEPLTRDLDKTADPRVYWVPVTEPLKWAGAAAGVLVLVALVAVPVSYLQAQSQYRQDLKDVVSNRGTPDEASSPR